MPAFLPYERFTAFIDNITYDETAHSFGNRSAWYEALYDIERTAIDLKKLFGVEIINWGPLRIRPDEPYPLTKMLNTKTTTRCAAGHTQSHLMDDLKRAVEKKQGEKLCKTCAVLKNGKLQHRDARVRMMMIHHERGEDIHLSTLKDMSKPYEYEYLPTGEVFHTTRSKVDQTYHSHMPLKDRVVHYAHDTKYAFVWASDLTPDDMYDPMKAALMADHYKGTWNRPDGRAYTGLKGYKLAVQGLTDAGFVVVNISHNPVMEAKIKEAHKADASNTVFADQIAAWYKPKLKYGSALVEYIAEIEKVWLDWQEGRLGQPDD